MWCARKGESCNTLSLVVLTFVLYVKKAHGGFLACILSGNYSTAVINASLSGGRFRAGELPFIINEAQLAFVMLSEKGFMLELSILKSAKYVANFLSCRQLCL